jgi:TRAP transporter TAXI family solute receptor
MKKYLLGIMVLLLTLCLALPALAALPEKSLSIVTAAQGGSWYGMGSRILKEVEAASPGLVIQVQPGGSVTNLNRLADGKVNLAMTVDFLVGLAYTGKEPYKKPAPNLRYLMKIVPAYLQMMTLKSSNINTFDDMLVKKFAPGQANLVTHLLLNMLLEVRGMTMDDIRKKGGVVNFVNTGPAAQMMGDGTLDAIMMAGNPATHSRFSEIAMTKDVDLLKIDPVLLKAVSDKYPSVKVTPMPEVTYPGIKGGFPTFATDTVLVTTDALSDDAAYLIVKSFYDNLSKLKADMNQFVEADLEKALEGNEIPVHFGALRYYRERGLVK